MKSFLIRSIRLAAAVWSVTLVIPDGASAAPSIGINLNGTNPDSTSALWVDVTNMFGPWRGSNEPWSTTTNTTVTALGFPTTGAWSWSRLDGYANTMALSASWTGGTLSVGADGTLSGSTITYNRGTGGSRAGNLVIKSDPTMTNLRILVPGSLGSLSNSFTDRSIQRLKPFGTTRYMDLQNTNSNMNGDWSKRLTPAGWKQAAHEGVAYEDIIKSSNATMNNAWINIPINATANYANELAKLLKNGNGDTGNTGINPALKIQIEYGNELWATNFGLGQKNLQNAQALKSSNPSHLLLPGENVSVLNDDEVLAARHQAYRLKQIYDEFKTVFGDDISRVEFVYNAHPDANTANGAQFTQAGLDFFKAKYVPTGENLSKYIGSLAIPAYFDAGVNNPENLSVNQLFAAMSGQLAAGGKTYNTITGNKAIANTYGLRMDAYEAGQHLLNAWDSSTANQAQKDPRMGQLYRTLYELWQANDGGVLNLFSYIDDNTQHGAWGLLERATDPGSVKWDTVMSLLLRGGDANLDGVVNGLDLGIFYANRNASTPTGGWWWEQGNFDGNSLLDAADYQLLRANLNLGALNAADLLRVQELDGLYQVPEPSALVGAGCVAFACLTRRRRIGR